MPSISANSSIVAVRKASKVAEVVCQVDGSLCTNMANTQTVDEAR